MKSGSRLPLRCICEGAILLALSQILGYLKLYELPQGGSVTFSMLPLLIFCCRWGGGAGLLCCSLFGLLQLMLDGAYSWGWASILFDYLLAYGALGLAGFLHGTKNNLFWGSLLGCCARFVSHLVSGYLYVRGTAAFSIYGVETASPWLYSAIYNGAYMLPNLMILLLAGLVLRKPMARYLRGGDLI